MGRNYKEMAVGFTDDGTGPQTNDDRPQSTRTQTRAQSFTGGTGGGRGIPLTRGVTPKPVSVKPPRNVGDFVPSPPKPVPPPPPAPEPAPVPAPPVTQSVAVVPYNTPVESLPGRKGIKQNPNRYRKESGEWRISASPDIAYLSLPDGTRPVLRPVLEGDGVIIKAGDFYLVSKQTLADIQNSGNPHYDIAVNGTVAGKPMGKTVPIVELDLTKLIKLAEERDEMNKKAGVKDVVYVHETPEQVEGLPKGVVDQINYVLNPTATRPADTFEVWGLTLKGDYNLQPLLVQTAQADGKLDRAKLTQFLTEVKSKMGLMEEDLNGIKAIFYEGKAPTGGGSTQIYTIAAQPQGESPVTGSTYIVKTSQTVAVVPTPIQKTQETVAETVTAVSSSVTEVTELTKMTAGVVGTLPEPVVPTKEEALLTKWNGWALTNTEKDLLKEPRYIGGIFTSGDRVTVEGESVRIDLFNWPQILSNKLRVIPNPMFGGPFGFGAGFGSNRDKEKLEEYFGTGKTPTEYRRLNNLRKAEALLTAKRIKALELKNGKKY